MLDYILFLVGFLFLVKGADLLVDGASAIAKNFKISDFIIGLTIVSLGTSTPELVVNVLASLEGSSEIAVGNIIGSNIANILLILGISAIIFPLPIKTNTILSEIPFSLTATILVGYVANATLFDAEKMSISRSDGFILLFFFFLFMSYIYKIAKAEMNSENNDEAEKENVKKTNIGKAVLFITLGIVALFFGGKWVVDGAIAIAESFGISKNFIGLTIVAVGTSLPELVTSATAAYKKNTDIAVGNVIGSNIFNLLWILGISASIRPLPFMGISNEDLMILVGASSLIILTMATGKKNSIDRWEGIIFVFLYVAYIGYLVIRE
ncbi:MAG: cation:H+ antiporter [Arenicella sp.]|jgi:cation:H+ antiporter